MRKSLLVGVVVTGTMGASLYLSVPASAWFDCGARTSTARAYSYAPGTYRSYYYGGSYYRPRVLGYRTWGWSGRRWGWRRW
jgi:hypothetical protein